MNELVIDSDNEHVAFGVRVSPRAARTQVLGSHNGALKLSLTAPPVDGAANQALISFLAKALSVSKSNVVICSGERSRNKRVRVAGATAQQIQNLLP